MKDDPIRICPECSGSVKRLLYPVGIVFKGSGWYVNDSRKPDTSDAAEKAAAKTDSADTASSSTSSAESSPAPAAAATTAKP